MRWNPVGELDSQYKNFRDRKIILSTTRCREIFRNRHTTVACKNPTAPQMYISRSSNSSFYCEIRKCNWTTVKSALCTILPRPCSSLFTSRIFVECDSYAARATIIFVSHSDTCDVIEIMLKYKSYKYIYPNNQIMIEIIILTPIAQESLQLKNIFLLSTRFVNSNVDDPKWVFYWKNNISFFLQFWRFACNNLLKSHHKLIKKYNLGNIFSHLIIF